MDHSGISNSSSFLQSDGYIRSGPSNGSRTQMKSIDWERITEEVEMRTAHLINTRAFTAYTASTIPPAPPSSFLQAKDVASGVSDYIGRMRVEEEMRLDEQKANENLLDELESLRFIGSQQRGITFITSTFSY